MPQPAAGRRGGGDAAKIPYQGIANALRKGKVVPFLGAGASVFHGPPGGVADPPFCPPTGAALAERLARLSSFPESPANPLQRQNLPLVASYCALVALGDDPLRQELREVFSPEFELNDLHKLLARVARERPQLIVTTNYDDMIERAFDNYGQSAFDNYRDDPVPYHLVVTNMNDIEKAGWVRHKAPGAKAYELVQPAKLDVSLEEASIIYKMHGSINRVVQEEDSYVITEEDYVRFLAGFASKRVASVPPPLAAMMKARQFLFLGYSLRDWNLRVLLDALSQFDNNASRNAGKKVLSWAIQSAPDDVEECLWERKWVNVYDLDLQAFVDDLAKALVKSAAPS